MVQRYQPYGVRRLSGVGGARFFDLPGVKYPDKALHVAPGTDPATGEPYTAAPPGWISTDEAAVMLGCGSAAARKWLHEHNEKFMQVKKPGRMVVLYWRRARVEQYASTRAPRVDEMSADYIGADAAMALLKVARSSLHRFVKLGLLEATRVRMPSRGVGYGSRIRLWFRKAQVRYLATKRKKRKKLKVKS